MEELWEDNIKELLAWVGYHKTLEQLTPHEAQELHRQVDSHHTHTPPCHSRLVRHAHVGCLSVCLCPWLGVVASGGA